MMRLPTERADEKKETPAVAVAPGPVISYNYLSPSGLERRQWWRRRRGGGVLQIAHRLINYVVCLYTCGLMYCIILYLYTRRMDEKLPVVCIFYV